MEDLGKSVMDRYEDIPEADVVSEKGRPPDKLVRSLTCATYVLKDAAPRKVKYRCVAAPHGCTATWSNRARDRVLKHAAKCKKLPEATIREVNTELGGRSLTAQLERQQSVAADADSESKQVTPSQTVSAHIVKSGSLRNVRTLHLAGKDILFNVVYRVQHSMSRH